MESLEKKIGYKFHNSLYMAEALTHPSLAYETQRPHFDNQRLEFLGDAVLQLVLTHHLFAMFEDFDEGRLTKLRSRLVSRAALTRYANSIDLGEYLMMGKGEESSGGRNRSSTLADSFESLIGAIYLDGRLQAARDFILNHCWRDLDLIAEEPREVNPKGQLQELLQGATAAASPRYRIISQSGPDHCKEFISVVECGGKELGRGLGKSKKEAEIKAAEDALEHEEVIKLELEDNKEVATTATTENPLSKGESA